MEEKKKEQEWHHVVTVEDLEGLNKRINVVYDSIAVKMAFDKACKLVGKQAQVKGFRKGKAPRKLLERAYPEKIQEVAGSLLSQEGFLHACYEHKIVPLGEPKMENIDFLLDGTFSCDILVEIKPIIDIKGYLGLKLHKIDVDVDQMADQLLEDVKQQHMISDVIEEVKSGSYVTIDYWTIINGEKISEGKDQVILVNDTQEPPFGKNLIGSKRGEMLKENIVMPEVIPEHGGKDAEVNIEVKLVCEKHLPTNEELVKKMSAPSYEELLDIIRQNAEMEANNRQRRSMEEERVDKLIEMHEFDIPKEWVADEEKYLEKQLNLSKIDDEVRKSINSLAERNVRRSFLLEAVYDAEKELTVTKEELDNVLESEAKRLNVSKLTLKSDLQKKGMLDGVVSMMKHKKVFDLIISQAQFGNTDENQPDLIIPENMTS